MVTGMLRKVRGPFFFFNEHKLKYTNLQENLRHVIFDPYGIFGAYE